MQDGRTHGRNWSLIKSQSHKMAGFKTQIIARFKVKFPKVTLSKERLNSIADKLDAKTDDEDSIDGNLDTMNEFFPFADIQKADDKLRDLESKVKPPKDKDPDPEKPEDKPNPADMPEWAKGLVTGIQTLTSELTAIKGEKIATTRREQLSAKLKDTSEAYRNSILEDFEMMNFKDDEAFTAYLGKKEEAAKGFIQEESNKGLGRDKPNGGNSKPAGDKEVSAEMKELIAERTAAAEAKAGKTA